MDGFSPVDGFVEIAECLAEMMKYLANEPSVGLFYMQQHTQNTVPNLVNLKNNVRGKSHELSLQTEDSDESVTMVRSIKECGFPIIDEMVNDITKSLAILSTKEPRKGLINYSSPRFQLGRTSSWASRPWMRKADTPPQYSKSTNSYFMTMFKSSQEKAGNLNLLQFDSSETTVEKLPSYLNPALSDADATTSSTEIEVEELPVSCQIAEEVQDESQTNTNLTNGQLSSKSDNFDAFKTEREAKLEEWLKGTSNHVSGTGKITTNNMKTHSDVGEVLTSK
ncbi:BLOC-1-related complex subunit like [Heracleum sosnowskyi]|uniref:BLOC-1-related complex subunit like n=1 Tax=Heracleum sosnowskyi TaxID=360622 RepID=A0AAD8MRP4_9APIA|nr:BLOC-1-related complex subunit like [Heracleum sosnowskyi]